MRRTKRNTIETTSNSLRFNYNSQTKQQTKSIATKNKQRFSMIQFTNESRNKLQNKKKDHKEKSNNKLIEDTYEDTYSSR